MLERIFVFSIVFLLLSPLVAVVESLRDQGKDGQRLPHAHLVGQNATPPLVWLDVLLSPGLGDSVAVSGVVTSAMGIEFEFTSGALFSPIFRNDRLPKPVSVIDVAGFSLQHEA